MGSDKNASSPLIFHPLVDRLLPANRRDATGIEGLRARVLMLSALAVSVWGPIFAIVYWQLGELTLAWLDLAVGLMVGPTLYLCIKHRSVALGGNALAFILFALLFFICTRTGGISASTLKWMPLVPLVGYLLGGWRSCVGWMLVAIATIGFFVVAPPLGLDFPMQIDEDKWRIAKITGQIALVIIFPFLFALSSGLQGWLVERIRREEAEKRRVEAELRQAKEAALARSQRSLRSLIQHSPDGIVVFRDGMVVSTNPAFRKILGYDGEDALVGSLLVGLVASDERAKFIDLLDRIRAGDEVAYQEICFLRTDGEVVICEVTGMVGAHEGSRACFCLVRDITQRKEVQGKMMHLDRMNAVGTLAAGVAHEINNPLAYVHSNTEFLLSQTSKYRKSGTSGTSAEYLSREELVEALEDIREGTGRIRSIVSDLGTFSEPNTHESGPVDVADLMRSVLKMADNQLRHRAKLVTHFDDVPAVEANDSNLAQVFLNLVVNAAQAIPEGALEQNEVRVAIGYDEERDQVIIEVSDTGLGIDEEVQPRIFDPFFSTKGQGEGMGLGLFICRNIVRDHRGELCFESTPGEGTTFRVELPKSDREADSSREFETPKVSEGFVGRVLVIDDEVGICRTISRVLRSSYHTVAVNSGREALELLERDSEFEVIICDLLMPDVSGVEVYEFIRTNLPEIEARTIFVTGGTFTERSNAFVSSTQRPVVLKPFDIKEFREVVDTVAQG